MEKVFANMPNQSPMPMKATRILEINPNHPIFETLKTLYASDKDKVKEVIDIFDKNKLNTINEVLGI